MLLDLLVGQQQLDTGFARDLLQSFERLARFVGGLPCVITAARRTALGDRCCDSVVDVVGELGALTMYEVEENFPVSFRPR